MDPNDFTAEGIRARLQKRRDAQQAEQRAQQTTSASQNKALREAFDNQQLPPDVFNRVMLVVNRAIENGEKDALVYRFPSDFMTDSGRSITSGIGDWTQKLEGAAARAYGYFKSDLEPRGFSLRAGIVDYKDGMPGDVGFYLSWAKDDA